MLQTHKKHFDIAANVVF